MTAPEGQTTTEAKGVRHLEGSVSEFTACGIAFDAFESGDADAPVAFAAAGQSVTCQDCADVVAYYKSIDGRRIKPTGAKTP